MKVSGYFIRLFDTIDARICLGSIPSSPPPSTRCNSFSTLDESGNHFFCFLLTNFLRYFLRLFQDSSLYNEDQNPENCQALPDGRLSQSSWSHINDMGMAQPTNTTRTASNSIQHQVFVYITNHSIFLNLKHYQPLQNQQVVPWQDQQQLVSWSNQQQFASSSWQNSALAGSIDQQHQYPIHQERNIPRPLSMSHGLFRSQSTVRDKYISGSSS